MLATASGLQQLGVQPEDRVLLVIEHGIDHLLTYFASIYIGAIPVHLSVAKPKNGIALAAEITSARWCVEQNHPEDLSDLPFNLVRFTEIAPGAAPAVPGHCDIAYMMFTSGTTGIPKAVMTSHANTIATAESIIDFAQPTANDRELISLPLAFTFGLGHIHALIIVGGEAFITNRRYELDYLAQAIEDERATGFLASPAMLRELITDHREQFIRCGNFLRYLVVNCTPMEPELTAELLELLPNTQIIMYYGMTEASRCAYIHYNENRHRLDFTGKRTVNVELKIDNPNSDGLGEICMRGPNVMAGYWNNPEATAKAIDAEGWIRSGDLGIMDADGYIKVIGRINDQISVDGMKCQPMEVERAIRELSFVSEVAVCALPGPLPAYYRDLIRDHCRNSLEKFKVPVVVESLDRFPANELGKVNRKQLSDILIQQLQEA
jgi:long-chain acyl-CoA synthetase